MTDASSYTEELARQLLAHEIGDGIEMKGVPPIQIVAAGDRVLTRLRERLAQWFGPDGYQALFVRALERIRSTHPVMDTVIQSASRTRYLEGLDTHVLATNPGIVADGIVALIAMLLTLLARFVGDDMVWHLMNQSNPQPAQGESRQ